MENIEEQEIRLMEKRQRKIEQNEKLMQEYEEQIQCVKKIAKAVQDEAQEAKKAKLGDWLKEPKRQSH